MGDAGSPLSPSPPKKTPQETVPGIPLTRSSGLTLILHTPKGFADGGGVSNWPYVPPKENINGIAKPPTPTTTQAIVLGLGSIFNHSTLYPNVGWERDIEHLLMTYTAIRDIKEGEELCISYGSRLTFEDIDTEAEALKEVGDENELLSVIELID
ncbi:hypothetical protein SBOR_2498 [Sclerotinia borealis F-4128]|uniref:SET domain-containing protein n=1 Tax=Sclerotinia borealis (strain F-4128) TaxID=1432307 RepID=W9CRL9_SCLBF|nr:hypothetical protein SBOR_2498 [Sclerotinia borealis F-4128]